MVQPAARTKRVEEYYFSRKLTEVRALDTPEHRVINLGIGSPDMAPSKETISALIDSAENSMNHGYQNYRGVLDLRKAIAGFYLNEYQTRLDVDHEILPLMGSKEGIMHISMAFLNEGDEVLFPDPGYPTYSSVTALVGGKARTYSLNEENNWSVDIDALRKSDLSKVKIMWVNYPHMPTGATASLDELAALVELARENNFLIVNDNPYSMILNDHPMSILSVDNAMEVALELNSLSKSHNMAGWRVGWVAGSKEHLDAVLKVKSNMDSGMFLGIQHAAAKALQSRDEWFQALNATYRERREIAYQILDELGASYSLAQSGLFVWAKCPDHILNVENWIDEILYATKVFITPGFIFGEGGRRYVRISLCASVTQLGVALLRIKKFNQTKAAVVMAEQQL